MMKYHGFSIQCLLNKLHAECEKVRLQKIGNDGEWRLYVFSNRYGEYENDGALSSVVINASKPFLDKWKAEREETQKQFKNNFQSAENIPVPSEGFINWNQMSELGLIERINREILHPLGLAVTREPDSGNSTGILVAPDGLFEYSPKIETTIISDDEVRNKLKAMG